MIKYFYCPECGNIYKSTVRENIYTLDKKLKYNVYYSYECDCGEPAVEIDCGMVNIIKTLNDYGLTTQYCCEGHVERNGDYSPAYITFDHSISRDFFEKLLKVYPLPKGWDIETYDNAICYPDYDYRSCVTIRYNELNEETIPFNRFQSIKIKYLNTLLIWVFSLRTHKIKSSDKK